MRSNGMDVKKYWVSRITAGIIGVVFIGAAIIKGLDIELFIRQIKDYGIMDHHVLLTVTAWSLVALELSLGASLMVYYKPRTVLAVTGFLVIFFILITAKAWADVTLEDCGCFGRLLKRSPKMTIIEDTLLLGDICLAWMTHQSSPVPKNRVKPLIPVFACLVGLILPLAVGFSLTGSNNMSAEVKQIDFQNILVNGIGPIDLSRGTYLVELMSTDCSHCKDSVPMLNFMTEENEVFKIVALCLDCEEERNRFASECEPAYPIGQIDEDHFWQLVGDGSVPRFLLVHNSRIQKVWDETVPDWETIMNVLHS
jgi:uncharacterized membrane protein YphA (DoxX/SURF4 family)